jgi:hypothetical protein
MMTMNHAEIRRQGAEAAVWWREIMDEKPPVLPPGRPLTYHPPTDELLEWWFTYHPTTPQKEGKYEAIRAAALEFAKVVRDNTPEGPDQSLAIRKIREAVMTANAAIACGGK